MKAAWALDQGSRAKTDVSMAKIQVADTLHRAAYENGINFFDTADVYGQGDSERLLGRVFRGDRDKILICSKAGLSIAMSRELVRWAKPVANLLARCWRPAQAATKAVRQRQQKQRFDAGYIRGSIHGSLKRLGTDYLDLFLLHCPPWAALEDGALVETMNSLTAAGKIRYWGISCLEAHEAPRFLELPGLSCIQVTANAANWGEVKGVVQSVKLSGSGVIARAPYDGGRLFADRPEASSTGGAQSRCISDIALRWIVDREETDVVLVGMACRAHLRRNLVALDGPGLTAEEQRLLLSYREAGSEPGC